jgi:hypothetical protein
MVKALAFYPPDRPPSLLGSERLRVRVPPRVLEILFAARFIEGVDLRI